MKFQTPEFLHTEWKILLDGIEVPYVNFSVVFPENASSTAIISMEPDRRMYDLRPQTMVHIFMRDRFATPNDNAQDDFLDNFFLYWEGVTTGIVHATGATGDSMDIRAEGLTSIFDNSRAFQIGVGPMVYSPFLSGSTLNPVVVGTSDTTDLGIDLLSIQFLTAAATDVNEAGADEPFRDAVAPTFVHRVLRVLAFLSAHNSLLRQQVVRSRLLDKICGIPDSTLGGLLDLSLLQRMMGNMSNVLNQGSSVMDILRYLLSFGFYRTYQVPLPHTPKEQSKAEAHPTPVSVDGVVKSNNAELPKGTSRNDVLFLPETAYALPPPCNFIFPEMISGLNVTRNYMIEPTRFAVQDPFLLATGVSIVTHIAPPAILRSGVDKASVSSGNLLGVVSNIVETRSSDKVDASGYASVGLSGADVNLLYITSDLELEKGVVLGIGVQGMELSAAAATGFTLTDPADPKQRKINNSLADIEKSGPKHDYARYMAGVTQYLYQMARLNRTTRIVLQGHRWLVPGFPCIIFNDVVPYIGHVSEVGIQVTETGQEISNVVLNKVRAVPNVSSLEINRILANTSKASESANKAKLDVSAAFNTKTAQLARLSQTVTASNDVFTTALDKTDVSIGSLSDLVGSDNTAFSLVYQGVQNAISSTEQLIVEAQAILRNETSPPPIVDISPKAKLYRYVYGSSLSIRSPSVDGLSVESDTLHANQFPRLFDQLSAWLNGRRCAIRGSVKAGSEGALQINSIGLRVDGVGPLAARDFTYALSIQGIMNDTTEFARAISQWLQDYYEAQREDALAGNDVEALSNTPIAVSVAALKAATKVEADTADDLLSRFEQDNDWLVPPSFFSRSLLRLDELDKTYQTLLGCKPFYTSDIAKDVPSASIDLSGDGPLSKNEQIATLLHYLRGLAILNRVYPILPDTGDKGLYLAEVNRSGIRTGLFEWAESNFIRRSVTSTRDMLQANGLKLVLNTTTGGVFYEFTPGSRKRSGPRGLYWDDSIFSKIVDDRALFKTKREADQKIAEVRQTAQSAFLTTTGRQAPIREYAIDHFSSSGFGRE